jgi:hypothetical protein
MKEKASKPSNLDRQEDEVTDVSRYEMPELVLEGKSLLLEVLVLMAIASGGIMEGAKLLKVPLSVYDPLGPGGYILLISILLLMCTIIQLAINVKRRTLTTGMSFSLHCGPAGLAVGLLFLYAITSSFVGYFVGSALFFVLVQQVFGERSWPRSSMLGLAFTIAFYLVFSYIAGVPLP